MDPKQQLAALTSTLLSGGRSPLSALAATLLVLAPVLAHAQVLPSTPLQLLLPLPVAPLELHPITTAQEPAGSFLKGRFLIGVNVTYSLTPDDDLGSHWSISPFIRNTPRRLGGGRPSGSAGTPATSPRRVDGRRTTLGEVKIRPLMGGIRYSIGNGPLRTSFSLVGGYAFTSAEVTSALPSGTAASIDITDAWVVRPNVGLTYALTRRLALVGSVGYVFSKPTITITINQQGRQPRRFSGPYRSDYVSITVGLAFSIF